MILEDLVEISSKGFDIEEASQLEGTAKRGSSDVTTRNEEESRK